MTRDNTSLRKLRYYQLYVEIKNAVPLLGCDRLLVVRDIKQMQRLHWVINAGFYYANIVENNVVL